MDASRSRDADFGAKRSIRLAPKYLRFFFFYPERIVVIIDAISCNASFLNLNNSPINL